MGPFPALLFPKSGLGLGGQSPQQGGFEMSEHPWGETCTHLCTGTQSQGLSPACAE